MTFITSCTNNYLQAVLYIRKNIRQITFGKQNIVLIIKKMLGILNNYDINFSFFLTFTFKEQRKKTCLTMFCIIYIKINFVGNM
jgi:hypothetical protein